MGNAFIKESTLTDIANVIRTKTGGTDLLLPSQMADAILNSSSGNVTIDGVKVKDDLAFKSILEDLKSMNLPYNFYNGSAVVLNGEIHILGGGDSSDSYTKHYTVSVTLYALI